MVSGLLWVAKHCITSAIRSLQPVHILQKYVWACVLAYFMNRTVPVQRAFNKTEQVTKCIFQLFLVCQALICFSLYCHAEYTVGFFSPKRTARVTRFVYHRLEMGHRIFGALLRRLPWKLTVSACKVCLIVICLQIQFLAFICFSVSSLYAQSFIQ